MAIGLLHSLVLTLALAAGGARAAEPPLWFAGGRPTAQAAQAIQVLAAAAEQGLDPRDYDADLIGRQLALARQGPALGEESQAALDSALTTALQRYLADLRTGRVDPRRIHAEFDVLPAPPAQDSLALLRAAVAGNRVAEALREAEPRLPMYAPLRAQLARYRSLGDHAAWRTALPPLPGRKLAPGQAYAGVHLLAQRLEALGDLPAGTEVPSRFEGVLVTALQAFQERHGLTPDGVLGAATLQQLAVTPAARVRQMELALERLRWTPFLQAPRMIVVNVPEFVLRAYEVHEGKVNVQLAMKVIVGKAMDTRTPLFDEDMRFIEFSPYWNVPPSIARGEVVPRLRRDPAYFSQQGFEFVTPGGAVVNDLSAANLDDVLRSGWRIRQRPGARNALGSIKFVFPNRNNIYLHHTPAAGLFGRDRRDFSHGCIRVEEPVALARFVLRDEPGWTEERIRAAMERGESNTLRLAQPVPALIAYSTVIVKGARVFFYADIYGHDRLLDQALRQRGPH